MNRVASVLGVLATGGVIGIGVDRLWLAASPRDASSSAVLSPAEPVPQWSPAELIQGYWIATAVEHRGKQPPDLAALVNAGGLKYRITADRLECLIENGGTNGYRLDLTSSPTGIEFFDSDSGEVTRRGIMEVTAGELRLRTNDQAPGERRVPRRPCGFGLAKTEPDDTSMQIVLKREQ